jgi:pimeloyl-ACP methyl ester carboxylesterase
MHILRTRFKQDIVAEFLPPARRGSRKVAIVLDGMPSVPSKRALLEFLSKKGYWAFHSRYRGSWESRGKLFARSPHEDVIDVIDGITTGFRDLWSGTRYKLLPKRLVLIGSSFGGCAAILASRDPRVTSVVAFSPVVDWRAKSKTEPMGKLARFIKEGFGEGYRVAKDGWKKLSRGTFYNPAAAAEEIDGKKLFIVHAKDDDIVSWRSVQRFAKKTGAKLKLLRRGGHSLVTFARIRRYI